MKKFLIISFDALEYDLVEQFDMKGLKQAEYGKIDLSPVLDQCFMPITDQIYPTFISGRLPSEHHIKSWMSVRTLQEQNIPTLFNLPKSLAINVPIWSYNIMRHKFIADTNKGMETMKEDLMENEVRIILDMIGGEKFPICRKHLVMIHFIFPDLLGHTYGHVYNDNINLLLDMYEIIARITEKIKYRFNKNSDPEFGNDFETYDKESKYMKKFSYLKSDGPPITMIMSDHGMKKGEHTRYGFYSLSEPLGWQGTKINEFYDKIKQVAYSNLEGERRLKEHLKTLGYL